jgi:hypothetical protein
VLLASNTQAPGIYPKESELQIIKSKSNPITGLDRPRVFKEVEVLIFQDNQHMKVARLSGNRIRQKGKDL